MIVLDASAVVELLLNTAVGAAVARRIRGRPTLASPHLIDVEVAQAVRRLVRLRQIEPWRGAVAIQHLVEFDLVRFDHVELLPRIWALRASLSAYDAAYLTLAEVLDAPLLTCDGRLARAARGIARVELLR
ncbi:MAG: ribonuclease VapC [Candidatus Binatia bacterium]|nr:MAG: ribonuclease VapC [Candidatus Binatia bacterium]